MKESKITAKHVALIGGFLCFFVCVFMLYFRPHESWCDDAFWADWAYRLSQGGFGTYVWGGGRPSYAPLYAIIMAGWYKVVGFSFFTAQLPNLIFALLTYLVLYFRMDDGSLIKSKIFAICICLCFWFADTLFWIFNCGRVDTLCLLFGILTFDSFTKAYQTKSIKSYVGMCVWAALNIATGVEGVVFTVVLLIVYSLMHISLSLKNWRLYVWYIVSSFISFFAVTLWMTYHNCGKAFLRTTFGFSASLDKLYDFLGISHSSMIVKNVESSLTFVDYVHQFLNLCTNAMLANMEYLVLVCLLIVLLCIVVYQKRWNSLSDISKSMTVSAIIIPWVFLLAGRYTTYYTWAAYIPCCYSVFVLLQVLKVDKFFTPIIAGCMLIWFCVSPRAVYKRIDFDHTVDKRNMEDISLAKIKDNEPVYIPYEWYYYLAPKNENLFFYWSWGFPKSMKKMVVDESEEDKISKMFELEYSYSIGKRKVYSVAGDYGQNILQDR